MYRGQDLLRRDGGLNRLEPNSAAVLITLLFLMPLDSQPNQPLDQLRIRQARGGPELGIHADRSESRHGVDLIQIDLPGLRIHQEIYPAEPGAVHGAKGADCKLLNFFGFRLVSLAGIMSCEPSSRYLAE